MAETFHLLEEALRSDCAGEGGAGGGIGAIGRGSARAAAARASKWWCCRMRLLQQLSGTETSQGVIALVQAAGVEPGATVPRRARWWWCSTACRIPATPAPSCARRRLSAPPGSCS